MHKLFPLALLGVALLVSNGCDPVEAVKEKVDTGTAEDHAGDPGSSQETTETNNAACAAVCEQFISGGLQAPFSACVQKFSKDNLNIDIFEHPCSNDLSKSVSECVACIESAGGTAEFCAAAEEHCPANNNACVPMCEALFNEQFMGDYSECAMTQLASEEIMFLTACPDGTPSSVIECVDCVELAGGSSDDCKTINEECLTPE